MSKAQLCQHMAEHFRTLGEPITRDVAREFLAELQRVCARELTDRGQFRIPKVVKLVMEPRPPRRGRDPVTGEPMVIPARRVLRARASSVLRDALEEPLETNRRRRPTRPGMGRLGWRSG